MNRLARPAPELVMTPEGAAWMLYAGLVQGLRWRRHVAETSRPPALPVPARRTGPARR